MSFMESFCGYCSAAYDKAKEIGHNKQFQVGVATSVVATGLGMAASSVARQKNIQNSYDCAYAAEKGRKDAKEGKKPSKVKL